MKKANTKPGQLMKCAIVLTLLYISLSPAIFAQTPAAKSNFFQTSDGTRIHYLEAGNGRAIVFIPGWTMPAWIWQKQLDGLSGKYHVIAVDPRSQGESDKPPYGHLPENRAHDYKELVDHLGLKQPALVGWSMGCGELLKYVDQFGTANVGAVILVDGFAADKPSPEMFSGLAGWMNMLQQDRAKQADGFVRHMYLKPQPEDYLKRVIAASMQVPADAAVVLIYNMLAINDWSTGFAKIDRPLMFAYQPENQSSADFLKSKLGDKVRLEKFDGDGHALFVDDPDKFNRVLDEFLKSVPQP
jgi:non-heme chloroperoxidase